MPEKVVDALDCLAELDAKDGIITTDGIFGGHPTYVPYYYELALDGQADEEHGDAEYTFDVTMYDMATFPALCGIDHVHLAIMQADQEHPHGHLVVETESVQQEANDVSSMHGESDTAT